MKHETTTSHSIKLEKEDVAYIKLPEFESEKISKTINLKEIFKEYKGCDVMLDVSEEGILLGIEILA